MIVWAAHLHQAATHSQKGNCESINPDSIHQRRQISSKLLNPECKSKYEVSSKIPSLMGKGNLDTFLQHYGCVQRLESERLASMIGLEDCSSNCFKGQADNVKGIGILVSILVFYVEFKYMFCL